MLPLPSIDWQGHRGCRGLLPENTIPAFLRALAYAEVRTLELDVVVTADDRVLVSHEPWLSPEICSDPAGSPLSAVAEDRISTRSLTLAAIGAYDCGRRRHPRFPEQVTRPATKPSLSAVFAAVDRYCAQTGRPAPDFNIELKFEEALVPDYLPGREAFVDLVLADVMAWGHPDRVILQCFDPPVLALIHGKRPTIRIAYLDEFPGAIAEKMDRLGFLPPIYSPYEIHVDAALLAEARELGLRVVPWTVNDPARMAALLRLGVAGIITDYPDRIASALQLYHHA